MLLCVHTLCMYQRAYIQSELGVSTEAKTHFVSHTLSHTHTHTHTLRHTHTCTRAQLQHDLQNRGWILKSGLKKQLRELHDAWAKCTVRVIHKSSQMCIQAHDNMLEVLPHINLHLLPVTRRPQNIGFPGYAGTRFIPRIGFDVSHMRLQ